MLSVTGILINLSEHRLSVIRLKKSRAALSWAKTP